MAESNADRIKAIRRAHFGNRPLPRQQASETITNEVDSHSKVQQLLDEKDATIALLREQLEEAQRVLRETDSSQNT